MAAAAPGAGDGVQQQRLALGVHGLQRRHGRVQAKEAAQVQQPALLPRLRQHQRRHAAQRGEIRVAVGLHREQPVQPAAQDHHHQPPVALDAGEADAGQAEDEAGAEAQEKPAPRGA